MGTWGAGNLDNDSACDELVDRTHQLVESILKRARSKAGREGDEKSYTTLFVEFEILFAMEKAGLLRGDNFPKEDDVEELKQSYIEDWSAYIDKLSPKKEHKKRRRRIILRTFNQFKKICGDKA